MRPILKSVFALGAVMLGSSASAEGVYRTVDESGRVIYSDRPAGKKSAAVKSSATPTPSRYEYESARMRAESERLYQQRLEAENRQRPPVTVYDPRGLQRPVAPPKTQPGVTIRRDPNLPDSPPPTTERQYNYNGR
jgi:uncharacterized protein DUF4124